MELKTYICLSGLVFTTSVYLPLLNQVNKCVLDVTTRTNQENLIITTDLFFN